MFENKNIVVLGLARSGIFMFQNYKKGIDGQPENEEEKAKKDAWKCRLSSKEQNGFLYKNRS